MDFQEILINGNTTILEALRILDQTAQKVLFISNEGTLVASLSDGDVRRWILKQGQLTDPVSKAANFKPIYLTKNQIGNAKDFMMAHRLQALPIVDDQLRILDILFFYDQDMTLTESFSLPVVIMAGGKGTRLYPYTKILPKPLIPIGEIPISEHIINNFVKYGCHEFWFVVNYRKNMIKAYYSEIEKGYSVNYVDEDTPLGTGGGISLLKGKISSTFILTNCDTLIDDDFSKILIEHKKKHNTVTMVCSLRNYEVPYGVVKIGKNGSIESMQEKPSMSFFTNTGTYIVEPEVIDVVKPGETIGFPDIVQRLKDTGKRVGVYPINQNAWLDMGQFDTMDDMKKRLHIKE